MGAALRAIWFYLREKEGSASLKELTDDFISLDESTRSQPETSNVSQYADIYQCYMQINNEMKPLLEGK